MELHLEYLMANIIANMDMENAVPNLYSLTKLRKKIYNTLSLKNSKFIKEFLTIKNIYTNLNIINYFTYMEEIFLQKKSFTELLNHICSKYDCTFNMNEFESSSHYSKFTHITIDIDDKIEYISNLLLASCNNHYRKESFQKKETLNFSKDFNKLVSFDFSYDNSYNVVDIGISSYINNKQYHTHYIVKENYPKQITKNSKYFCFNFGKTKVKDFNNIRKMVYDLVRHSNWLIFHDCSNDLRVLEKFNIEPDLYSSKIIDTSIAFNEIKSTSSRTSLRDLLLNNGIYYKRLHNSGNDAAYTLKAFIKNVKKNPIIQTASVI